MAARHDTLGSAQSPSTRQTCTVPHGRRLRPAESCPIADAHACPIVTGQAGGRAQAGGAHRAGRAEARLRGQSIPGDAPSESHCYALTDETNCSFARDRRLNQGPRILAHAAALQPRVHQQPDPASEHLLPAGGRQAECGQCDMLLCFLVQSRGQCIGVKQSKRTFTCSLLPCWGRQQRKRGARASARQP